MNDRIGIQIVKHFHQSMKSPNQISKNILPHLPIGLHTTLFQQLARPILQQLTQCENLTELF